MSHVGAQLERLARARRRITSVEAEQAHDGRSLWWSSSSDKASLSLGGRLAADQGAVVVTALERLAERAPQPEDGTYEPFEALAADALVDVCSARLARDADADRATVVVHVDAHTLAVDGPAELENGMPLTAETARPHAMGEPRSWPTAATGDRSG